MSYYVKDSFDMPHNPGLRAIVSRMDRVDIALNLFGQYDAFAYADDAADPTETFPNIRIAVEDSALREKLGVKRWSPCYPGPDDVILWCEYSGDAIYWYRVSYEAEYKKNG